MEYTVFRRESAEYRQYVNNIIEEYNNNGKKTLLFVCDSAYPIVDGVWNVLTNYVKQLRENHPEFNVVVMCPTFKGDVYVQYAPVFAVKSIYLKSINYQLALPHFDVQLKRWLRKLRIDLIHCHSPFFCGLMVRKLHKKRGIPMVSTFHSQFKQDFMHATKSKALTKLGLNLIMKVFHESDEVWTMHTASRDTLFSYGYNGFCRLMPNATGMLPFSNYDDVRNDFRSSHGLDNKFMLIFVGRIIEQKGIFFIVDVLAELSAHGIDFDMYFVGDGPDAKRLKDKVADYNLNERVKFVGNVSDVEVLKIYYAAADLFLFPSRYDVSSIVQIEAATYKTPTAFSEGSVTSCTVTDGVNGYVFPYDVQKYAQGVIDVLQSGLFVQVGENALRDIHVNWEQTVNKSVENYLQLMGNRKE